MSYVTGLCHISMKVYDVAEAARFYGEGLGLRVAQQREDFALVVLPDQTFMEITAGGEKMTNTSGITHICLDTYDCDATFARAIEYGAVPSRGEPYDLGDLRIAFVYSPTGEEVEFWYVSKGEQKREPIVDDKYIKSFVHVALTVPDMEKSVEFYSKLGVPFKTGWGWGCSLKMEDQRELELFTGGEYGGHTSGIIHFCFWSDNADEALAFALEQGAKLHAPCRDFLDWGVRYCFFIGPGGEEVEIFQKL